MLQGEGEALDTLRGIPPTHPTHPLVGTALSGPGKAQLHLPQPPWPKHPITSHTKWLKTLKNVSLKHCLAPHTPPKHSVRVGKWSLQISCLQKQQHNLKHQLFHKHKLARLTVLPVWIFFMNLLYSFSCFLICSCLLVWSCRSFWNKYRGRIKT